MRIIFSAHNVQKWCVCWRRKPNNPSIEQRKEKTQNSNNSNSNINAKPLKQWANDQWVQVLMHDMSAAMDRMIRMMHWNWHASTPSSNLRTQQTTSHSTYFFFYSPCARAHKHQHTSIGYISKKKKKTNENATTTKKKNLLIHRALNFEFSHKFSNISNQCKTVNTFN